MKNLGNKSSTLFIFALFIILALILLLRNITLCFTFSYDYSDPYLSKKNIRGTIYDRHGNTLAFDTSSIGIKILDDEKREEKASFISRYIDYSPLLISSLINEGVTFFPLKKENDDDIKEIEKNINENFKDSLSLTVEKTRIYPFSYMNDITGLSLTPERGEDGIEGMYNEYLKAVPSVGVKTSYGEDIVLTLDIAIQETLCSALKDREFSGDAAILNNKGEILAFYGDVTDKILTDVTYSHSTKEKTELFVKNSFISLSDAEEIYPYYIYISEDKEDILPLIKDALKNDGRIN